MSPFEFFFTFYGLILGLAVAELLAGFARTLQAGGKVGLLPGLLAVFVAIDAATFWNQAWLIFRHAPFNLALLVLGLVIAGAFYVAAALVFPKDPGEEADPEAHFWRHRRTVLLSLLGANLLIGAVFMTVATGTGDIAQLGLGARFWIGFTLFTAGTIVAAVAKGRRVVIATLILLLAYYAFNISMAAGRIVADGGWPIGPRGDVQAER